MECKSVVVTTYVHTAYYVSTIQINVLQQGLGCSFPPFPDRRARRRLRTNSLTQQKLAVIVPLSFPLLLQAACHSGDTIA
jgi:hypothetical protein